MSTPARLRFRFLVGSFTAAALLLLVLWLGKPSGSSTIPSAAAQPDRARPASALVQRGSELLAAEHAPRLATEAATGKDELLRSPAVGEITGTLRWPDGSPAYGAEIQIYPIVDGPAAKEVPVANVKEDGSFRVGDLEEGRYAVIGAALYQDDEHRLARPEKGGWWLASSEFLIPTTGPVELTLDPQHSIRGRVMSRSGRRVESFEVRVVPRRPPGTEEDGRRPFSRDFESLDGSFEYVGLLPGAWRVHVDAADHLSCAPHVVEVPSSRVEDFLLTPSTEVSGTVVDAAGEPLRCRVSVEWPASSDGTAAGHVEVESSPEGEFRFHAVAAAMVTLRARCQDAESEPMVLDLSRGDPRDGVRIALPFRR